MNEFKLVLNDRMIKHLDGAELPNVPIKNIDIVGLWKYEKYFDMKTCVKIVDKYRATIETMKLEEFRISTLKLRTLLKNLNNLKQLELRYVELTTQPTRPVEIPSLKSLTFTFGLVEERYEEYQQGMRLERTLDFLKLTNSIETLQVVRDETWRYECPSFDSFFKAHSNIKHLKLESEYLDDLLPDLPLKLQTLQLVTVDFENSEQFLLSQKGSLKELRLESLPFEPETAAFAKTIYELNLETFYLQGIPLILNHETQDVEKGLSFGCEGTFKGALEIMKRGRCELKMN
jgi:hypothetical protein